MLARSVSSIVFSVAPRTGYENSFMHLSYHMLYHTVSKQPGSAAAGCHSCDEPGRLVVGRQQRRRKRPARIINRHDDTCETTTANLSLELLSIKIKTRCESLRHCEDYLCALPTDSASSPPPYWTALRPAVGPVEPSVPTIDSDSTTILSFTEVGTATEEFTENESQQV